MTNNTAYGMATAHVDWFLETLRPLLISHFEHGFKHGVDYNKTQDKTPYLAACNTLAKSMCDPRPIEEE